MISKYILGQGVAENDSEMLERAFYHSQDYTSLFNGRESALVIGRRGTGKSAIRSRLAKEWGKSRKVRISEISPSVSDMSGFRKSLKIFHERFNTVKAAASIAWKYAIIMESGQLLADDWKIKESFPLSDLSTACSQWRRMGDNIFQRIEKILGILISESDTADAALSSLPKKIEIGKLEKSLKEFLDQSEINLVFLIDQIDEGYEPDNLGIGIITGIVQGTIDLQHKLLKRFTAMTFVRDNIFRRIQELEQDFTRTIEGQDFRLRWNEDDLFNMIIRRIRVAFQLDEKSYSNEMAWNYCTDYKLHGREGFRHCLRLTLFRPRDLLVLLNKAFLESFKSNKNIAAQNSPHITLDNLATSAQDISEARLGDLHKEYQNIIPSLSAYTKCFHGSKSKLSFTDVNKLLSLIADNNPPQIQQDIEIYSTPNDVVKVLFGVGFLGINDEGSGHFEFCYDGKAALVLNPERKMFLVHPCYWIALGIVGDTLSEGDARRINDEIIGLTEGDWDARSAKIGALVSQYHKAEIDDDAFFDNWALESLRLTLSGHFRNFTLEDRQKSHGKGGVTAINTENSNLSKNLLTRFGCHRIFFMVANKDGLNADELWDFSRRLAEPFGNVGFILSRSTETTLKKGEDLELFREIHQRSGKVLIKLNPKFLIKILEKIRSPKESEFPNTYFSKLCDQYFDSYLFIPKVIKNKP